VEGALEHIKRAAHAGVLRGFFLSSVAAHDPVYGSWLDNHAPMQGLGHKAWEPQASLLTAEQVQLALTAAQEAPYWGVKIQPAPATLTLAERRGCLWQHLEFLSSSS
jgi:hypothetical protein